MNRSGQSYFQPIGIINQSEPCTPPPPPALIFIYFPHDSFFALKLCLRIPFSYLSYCFVIPSSADNSLLQLDMLVHIQSDRFSRLEESDYETSTEPYMYFWLAPL